MEPESLAEAVARRVQHRDCENHSITQWRKYWPLHEWMHDLWWSRLTEEERADHYNIAKNTFNCVELELKEGDLGDLEKAVESGKLDDDEKELVEHGSDYQIGDDRLDMLRFIKESRLQINKGNQVFYNSWW